MTLTPEPHPTSRTELAFAAEERRGLDLAIKARLFALVAVQLWLIYALPHFYALFHHLFIGLFLALGLTQMLLLRSRFDRWWHKYLFAALDGILLSAILLAPNPFLAEAAPAPMALRYANIIFYFVFLAGVALTYSPALVLWTGCSAMLAWGAGVFWLAQLDGVITSHDPLWQDAESLDKTIAVFLQPDFLHVNLQIKKIFVVLLISGLLAIVVWRARRLVRSQVGAERARTNLARYFSPNLVDQLAAQDEPLSSERRQAVAVLFADIQGFTKLCERLPPEDVVRMLRAFHLRMETAIFACGGTLDKYMGDGLMATFGTPEPGERDATDALDCARRMLAELDQLNRERLAEREAPLAIGIGIHYGPVVQGDIGGGQRLEFTVLGDTVNVASRLEAFTRDLGTPLVVSQDLIDQIDAEATAADLTGLVAGPAATIRGRTEQLRVWLLERPDPIR